MEIVIEQLFLAKSDNVKIIKIPNILYFTGMSGFLEYRNIKKIFPNAIVLVNNYSIDNIKFIKIPVLYRCWHDVYISELSQVMLIQDEFYSQICIPKFNEGVIEHVHSSLISNLFEVIVESSKPVYEVLAIANLIGVDKYNTDLNKDLLNIKKIIDESSAHVGFNLDTLSSKAFMSRRKVQYILSSAGLSFLDLVNKRRVKELKTSLLKRPKTAFETIAYAVGYRSVSTASRAFKKEYGLTIGEFRAEVKRLEKC